MKRIARRLAAATAFASALASPAVAQTVPTGVGLYSQGHYFGNLIDQRKVWMRFPDGDAYVYIDKFGKLFDNFSLNEVVPMPRKYYTTTDCSGTQFHQIVELPPQGLFTELGPTVSYPQRPYERIVARSVEINWSETMKKNSNICEKLPNIPMLAGKLVRFTFPWPSGPLTIR